MFHAVDTSPAPGAITRADRMALLARAPIDLLERTVGAHHAGGLHWLRRPETGLMMVQGRVGGTGERFHLGEITVTRCALRLGAADAPAGVAWVLGRDARRCTLAAVADALLQDPAHHDALSLELLQATRQHLAEQAQARQRRAQSTRVDFFTMARESDGGADDEDEA